MACSHVQSDASQSKGASMRAMLCYAFVISFTKVPGTSTGCIDNLPRAMECKADHPNAQCNGHVAARSSASFVETAACRCST